MERALELQIGTVLTSTSVRAWLARSWITIRDRRAAASMCARRRVPGRAKEDLMSARKRLGHFAGDPVELIIQSNNTVLCWGDVPGRRGCGTLEIVYEGKQATQCLKLRCFSDTFSVFWQALV